MKRNISILLTSILITLSLTGCGKIDVLGKSNPGSIIEEFISEMYNVKDYKAIDIQNLNKYPEDNYTNAVRKIATEDALQTFIGKRTQLLYISYCNELHVNSELISKNINKYTTNKDGSIVYDYDGKVKLTFNDENKQQEESIKGQITVNKVDNKWVITKFNDVNFDCIAKYYKEYKQ